MKKKIYAFLILVFAISYSSQSFGQVSSYYFTQSSGTFTPITGGTNLVAGSGTVWDDGAYPNLPIGFSFVYAGTTYTSFGIDIDGAIRMGSAVALTEYCPTNWVTLGSNIYSICGYMTDLHSNGNSASEVRYQTIGTSPNQQLVVQWLHCMHYAGNASDDWNFQIILNQTSNAVQVVWGPITDATTNGANNCSDINGESGASGLVGNGATDANLRVVTNGSTTWATSTGATTVTTTNVCNMSPTNIPSSGLTWTWGPTCLLSVTAVVNNATCVSCSDGLAFLNVTGGASPYSYSWSTSPAQTTDSAINLSNGTYSVCVTDMNGCSVRDSVTAGVGSCSAVFNVYPDTTTAHHYFATNFATGVLPLTYLWSWGDGTTDTAAYPSHLYASAGVYSICLTITDAVGCLNSYCYSSYLHRPSSSMISINVLAPLILGINDENELNYSENVFPNPFHNMLTVEVKGNEKWEITLFDVTSRMLIHRSIENSVSLNTESLAKGVYLYEVRNENGVLKQGKVVKE